MEISLTRALSSGRIDAASQIHAVKSNWLRISLFQKRLNRKGGSCLPKEETSRSGVRIPQGSSKPFYSEKTYYFYARNNTNNSNNTFADDYNSHYRACLCFSFWHHRIRCAGR